MLEERPAPESAVAAGETPETGGAQFAYLGLGRQQSSVKEGADMSSISLTIPSDAVAAMKIPRHRVESELKKQLAVQLYREGMISGAGACRVAEISKAEFQYLLGEIGVCQQYDVEDYHKDLEHLASWRASGS